MIEEGTELTKAQPVQFPEPVVWTFPNGDQILLYSYHHLKAWQDDAFIRNCEKKHSKPTNIAGAI